MLVNSQSPSILRNYVIVSATVITMSLGLTDLFYNPARVAQQDRIDNYTNYVKAGMVVATRNTLKSIR
jgi:hypothetical protein